ncbi:MAG TPA: SDR family oxidoreductase [Terriglobales bacterium]|nr:SDR family oxidoreductase [Terriglobales bacterium]
MRHVIVTGGTRGLGLEIVRALLKEGYRVSACGRKESAELQTLAKEHDGKLFTAQCSVEDEQQVDRFFHDAASWAGDDGIFGLVNNAGIAKEGILATFPNVESRKILEVNLFGALYCARAALRYMLTHPRGGRIINISSIIGSRGYTGLAAYSASKAGLDGLTRSLAREVGARKITVNSIAPGYMLTEMSASLNKSQLEQIVRRTPLGRLAEAADVVPALLFLLSDGAALITGQTLIIDGGITV